MGVLTETPLTPLEDQLEQRLRARPSRPESVWPHRWSTTLKGTKSHKNTKNILWKRFQECFCEKMAGPQCSFQTSSSWRCLVGQELPQNPSIRYSLSHFFNLFPVQGGAGAFLHQSRDYTPQVASPSYSRYVFHMCKQDFYGMCLFFLFYNTSGQYSKVL